MNLQIIATSALDEALSIAEDKNEQDDMVVTNEVDESQPQDEQSSNAVETTGGEESAVEKYVTETDNGDGTTTFSFSFTLDPAVQTEMARSIPKGMKRDDLADDIDVGGDENEEEDLTVEETEAKDEKNTGESVEEDSPSKTDDSGENALLDESDEKSPYVVDGEAQDSVFTDALDSIENFAEDARTEHGSSPVSACTAKDPIFCPYHGKKAAEEELVGLLSTNGSLPANMSVEVNNGKTKRDFSISIKCGANDAPAAQNAIAQMLSKRGIKPTQATKLTASGPGVEETAEYQNPNQVNKAEIMQEWVDDMLTDYASDPNSPVDPQELADCIAKTSEYYDQIGTPTENKAFEEAKEAYNNLCAQIDFSHVKTAADATKERGDISNIRKKAGDWWNLVTEAKHTWSAAGVAQGSRLNKYPASAQPIRKDFQTRYSNLYNYVCKPYEDANAEYTNALSQGDMKSVRVALGKLKYQAKMYEDMMPAFEKTAKEYIAEAKKSAQQKGVQVPQYTPVPWNP